MESMFLCTICCLLDTKENKIQENFEEHSKISKTYPRYLSQYVCNISLSILDYCVFVSDLYLHLHAFPMAIVIWPLQNRSFGIILEMCPDWWKIEPLCGLVLLSNGFSDFIHNVKISRGKVIQETSFHLQTQHSKLWDGAEILII